MDGNLSGINPDIEVINNNQKSDNTNSGIELIVPNQIPGDVGGDIQIDEDGEKGRVGAYVHCNRFNGPSGNQTYYADHTSTQAIKNFVDSDCDRAFIRYNCWNDYTASTNCKGLLYYKSTINSNPHNCSSAIGHSIKYHAH